MRRFNLAFTLVELLVVIAITTIVAAILFPVFLGARGVALRSACSSNLHQISTSTTLYSTDYDDRFMPTNYQPTSTPNSRNDRTWVQMILPYVNDFQVFWCPADNSPRPTPQATFDQDLVPGDSDSQYYTASQRTDYGYNYQNLAPVVLTGQGWQAQPKSTSSISDPSNTLMFADSVWSRTSGGAPSGGGNWLVVPPCRYYVPTSAGEPAVDSFTGNPKTNSKVQTPVVGWNPEVSEAGNVYGATWPWHLGRLNVAEVDGSIHSLLPDQLSQGCQVEGRWAGYITDPVMYMWDIR